MVALDQRAPAGFSVCKRLLGSKVEYLQTDLYDLPSISPGSFAIVICVDVLYNLDEPLRALQIFRQLCCGELHLTTIRHDSNEATMKFVERLYPDGNNRWAISPHCLEQMLDFVGFMAIEIWPYGNRMGARASVDPRRPQTGS